MTFLEQLSFLGNFLVPFFSHHFFPQNLTIFYDTPVLFIFPTLHIKTSLHYNFQCNGLYLTVYFNGPQIRDETFRNHYAFEIKFELGKVYEKVPIPPENKLRTFQKGARYQKCASMIKRQRLHLHSALPFSQCPKFLSL